ncbi:hypothetical protein AV530_002613 [Patagioenas fasciata monilis]|uniref:Uncharacterized protein n=1 Tax=Patagioenas fasciata monilis TaxID=372326 RepID=A0A1V4K749_PATFA|nr:hypothetical protein AV530_002613 [Patagioenas fasciata monilis]
MFSLLCHLSYGKSRKEEREDLRKELILSVNLLIGCDDTHPDKKSCIRWAQGSILPSIMSTAVTDPPLGSSFLLLSFLLFCPRSAFLVDCATITISSERLKSSVLKKGAGFTEAEVTLGAGEAAGTEWLPAGSPAPEAEAAPWGTGGQPDSTASKLFNSMWVKMDEIMRTGLSYCNTKVLAGHSGWLYSGDSLALRARDSNCNVNKGPLPNLMQRFMVTNHLDRLREETGQARS